MADRVLWLNYRLQGGPFETYQAMTDLSLKSARRFLVGNWQPWIVTADYTDRSFEDGFSDMYRDMFAILRAAHAAGDNTLFLDPDTLFLKPTILFGLLPEMRLFWLTDPPSFEEFEVYLNGGVAYFPAAMNPDLWRFADQGAHLMREWNDSQRILNAMFWAQKPALDLIPQMGWSPNTKNGCPLEEALLIHFNSTRGAENVLTRMREMSV